MLKNKIIAAALSVFMATPAYAVGFTDVADDAWYSECVEYVTDKGLFDSYGDAFAPQAVMTRGMLVTAIGRAEGVPAEADGETVFKDIPAGHVCLPYAEWAAKNGIVAGYGGSTFGPDDTLTREQLAVVFTNYCKYLGESTDTAAELTFADAGDISDWAADGVAFCTERGLVRGTDDNQFLPLSSLTRAEAAQVIYNMLNTGESTTAISGSVISIDHHGHITSDITVRDFTAAGFMTGDMVSISVNGTRLIAPYGTEYTDVDNDSVLILSRVDNAHISAAINMGSFADTYGISVGDAISFELYEKGGYSYELDLRSSYIYTYERNDYPSDEAFANFRAMTAGGIKDVYRSSTPIYSTIGRNEYADKLAKAAGIKTVINLTDPDMETVRSRDGYAGSYYSGLAIYPFRTNLQMDSDIFKANMAAALRVIPSAELPLLIHCKQGKDQTGLMAAMLEALCGADYEAIENDYMLSYENFYGIEHGSEQWQHFADGNILPSVLKMTGAGSKEELSGIDIQAAVREYMRTQLGLADAELDAIKSKLCGAN